MARITPWRRSLDDRTSWRHDQASNETMFIIREFGPTAYLLKEELSEKIHKVILNQVYLGDPHVCNCHEYKRDKDICKHICWLLLKKYRVPASNPITWQLGLVEREINEILRGNLVKKNLQKSKPPIHSPGKGFLEQRSISEDDICPICQEELLTKRWPVTYCRYGCGNNVHIKCMKIWAQHQQKSSTGDLEIKCPFCRNEFGPMDLLRQEFHNTEKKTKLSNEHLGYACRNCQSCPIVGKCYRCSVCTELYLCQSCYANQAHACFNHQLEFRQKSNQRWKSAPKGSGNLLPEAVVSQLMNRDISETDYDLLLQLDNTTDERKDQTLSEDEVAKLSMFKIRDISPLLLPGHQCRICLRNYRVQEFVRRLSCGHKFHRECIDQWLLHTKATCPLDGRAVVVNSPQENFLRRGIGVDNSTQQMSTHNLDSLLPHEISGVGLGSTRRQSEPTHRGKLLKNKMRHNLHNASSDVKLELCGVKVERTIEGVRSAPTVLAGAGSLALGDDNEYKSDSEVHMMKARRNGPLRRPTTRQQSSIDSNQSLLPKLLNPPTLLERRAASLLEMNRQCYQPGEPSTEENSLSHFSGVNLPYIGNPVNTGIEKENSSYIIQSLHNASDRLRVNAPIGQLGTSQENSICHLAKQKQAGRLKRSSLTSLRKNSSQLNTSAPVGKPHVSGVMKNETDAELTAFEITGVSAQPVKVCNRSERMEKDMNALKYDFDAQILAAVAASNLASEQEMFHNPPEENHVPEATVNHNRPTVVGGDQIPTSTPDHFNQESNASFVPQQQINRLRIDIPTMAVQSLHSMASDPSSMGL